MGTKICMNEGCRGTTSPEWKKGWGLKSGGFANLCYGCGSAYENLIFCETFHREESGWRECKLCGKHIHCGCIASRYLHEYLDFGGIGCISCTKTLDSRSIRRTQIPSNEVPNGFSTFGKIGVPQSSLFETRSGVNNVDNGNLTHSGKPVEPNDSNHFPQMPKVDMDPSVGKIKREETMVPMRELGSCFPNLAHQSVGSSGYFKPDNNNNRPALGLKDMYESLAQPSLSFSLSTPNAVLPFTSGVAEGKEPIPFQQGQRTRHILPKPPKTGLGMDSETSKGMGSQARIARPPAEGRGRNQLLPRYWPRITDQELQQLSGDLNSTIVPLFEKVLSASDAGRIGRLVLPKACAEAYFPPINYSEGLPIKIQDVKGKEWTFQFRFWPNNNSRMYVLEGVTPCIQNMQLQAGDTVIFSRIDPGGRLVMGFRKAKTLLDNIQDSQTSALPGESSFSGFNENLPTEKTNEDVSEQGMMQEKKKARNIGSKSKRLHIHSEDAYELRVTWEEAQELLRPPPSVNPTIVMVEDYEFEEYDEPPVFGKRTLFTAREYGEQEQWAHCDGCFKWRKLPLDVLLPPKWTCSDNIWDPNRCSCSAPEETSARELERCLRTGKEFKKRRITENKLTQEPEPSGLDALATAAVLGDNVAEADENIAGATTKHPRHRPGCTCIVCIQPPSGKGKHKPTCICNVCMTVKRRFKTLMLRKKKRQSEREAEMARGTPKDDAPPEKELEVAETVKGQQLDLNSHPSIAEETGVVSVMSLVQTSSFRFESYLKQKGLMVLDPSRAAAGGGGGERVEPPPESEKGGQESVVQEEENRGETG